MDSQKLTQKSIEAIQKAQNLTTQYKNSTLDIYHLLLALLTQQDGLIPELLKRQQVNLDGFVSAIRKEIENLPKIGQTSQEPSKIYISGEVDQVLNSAEQIANSMKDEYISVEHIFLS